ncbi:Zn finger family DNA binding protein [Mycena latifolia]|nr:Zn finger family DNA binding protein [Mycena latifolia]
MLSAHQPSPLPIPRFDRPQDPQAVPRDSHLFLQHIHHLVAHSVSPLSDATVEDDDPVSPSGPNYHYHAPREDDASYGPPYPYTAHFRRDSPFSPSSPSSADASLAAPGPGPSQRAPLSGSLSDPRYGALPKISTSNILERRMSEPSVSYMAQPAPASGAQNRAHQYSFTNYDTSPHSPESPFLPRVASLGALRHEFPPALPHPDWKQDPEEHRPQPDPALGSVSPFQPSFSAVLSASPPLQYAVRGEDNTYGPSPPGTSTSSSSTAPAALPSLQSGQDSPGDPSNKKTYSFVALPGNAVRKRPRRRYDEIERLYQCSWPECNKAYGTLNHLNAHVQMQKHGPKRSPNEFKELRKQWRKAKKEYESPGLGPIRRSMSLRREHHDLYHGHPYSAPHRSFSHNSALSPQLSVAIPHMRPDGTYLVDHHLRARPHRGRPRLRAPIYQSPLSSQPTYPYLDSHAQMMESPPSSNPYHSPTRSTMDRLPPDSMLLTPLGDDNYYDEKPRSGHPSNLDQGSGDEY